MGRPELADDPRYSNDQARLQRRAEVVKLIEEWLQTFPDVASAVAHMEKFQVPVAPVLSVAETVHHPHHRARGTVRTVHDPLHGEFDMPGMPLKFSRFPKDLPLQAATLGQHNEEILTTRLGRSKEEVQRLRTEGVLVEKEI
jgi:crotonobetainyl-CoA:carnitine CoA-transferase CaiB-like acyl-CoA transferase